MQLSRNSALKIKVRREASEAVLIRNWASTEVGHTGAQTFARKPRNSKKQMESIKVNSLPQTAMKGLYSNTRSLLGRSREISALIFVGNISLFVCVEI